MSEPTSAARWAGGTVTDHATCVLAPNASPMTLDGTNTWVLGRPGAAEGIVVDPGPLHEAHLQAVGHVAEGRGLRITLVLVTHHHSDHEEGAARFGELVGADVRGGSHGGFTDGETITVGGLDVSVLATPGHTRDSVSFYLPQDSSLLTGDTVLGRGTTVVAWPDGALAPYLASLERLVDLVTDGGAARILPAHGPVVGDPARVLAGYLRHRRERLDQVRAAVAEVGDEVQAVVDDVYADVPDNVRAAAALSVRAQLDYLREGH